MQGELRVYKYPGLRCRLGLRARLLLEDGLAVEGCGFGSPATRTGEVVFTTATTGYTESLTDPSYMGQILVEAHPMMGNYGVPARASRYPGLLLDYESPRIRVEGFAVAELPRPSHYASVSSLHSWLASEGIPGIYRVDTRFLIKHIRSKGVMMGVLAVYSEGGPEPEWGELGRILSSAPRYDEVRYAYKASPREPVRHRPMGMPVARVSLLDCGVKNGILRRLLEEGVEVTRYPCWTSSDVLLEGYDGVVIGNGPGNPARLYEAVKTAGDVASSGKPVLGICLGMQLLALGLGLRVYKLPYGHRAVNKPVVDNTGRCMVSTHNHGYAVDPEGLEAQGLEPWFWQPDDGTLEGFVSRDGFMMATQFHPEAGPGPWDGLRVFHDFRRRLVEAGRGG